MSLLFVTPMYGGNCHERHFYSCLSLKDALVQVGLPHDWLTGKNESLVHRARMEMTRTYLESFPDFAYMMWLDADIEFTPEDVAKVWNLASQGDDIVVGCYAMKKDGKDWYSAWKDGKLVQLEELHDPTEVDYAGTGFMCISRKALIQIHQYLNAREARGLALLSKIPRDALSEQDKGIIVEMANALKPDYEGPHGRAPALYMTPIHNDHLESEDYHFCRIAQAAGLKVIMDPSVRLTHWGMKGYGKKPEAETLSPELDALQLGAALRAVDKAA